MLLPSPLDHSVQRILCPTVFEPQIKLLNPPPFYIYVSFEIFRVGGWWVEELTFLAALRISVLIILVCQCRTVIFFSKNNLFLIGKVSDFGYVHKLSWRYICCQIFLLINPSLCILLPPFRTRYRLINLLYIVKSCRLEVCAQGPRPSVTNVYFRFRVVSEAIRYSY